MRQDDDTGRRRHLGFLIRTTIEERQEELNKNCIIDNKSINHSNNKF